VKTPRSRWTCPLLTALLVTGAQAQPGGAQPDPALSSSPFPPAAALAGTCKYRWDAQFQRYVHSGYLAAPLDVNALMQRALPDLGRFAQALRRVGTRLVVVPVPPDYAAYSANWTPAQRQALLNGFSPEGYASGYRAYLSALEKLNVPAVDVLTLAEQEINAGRGFYFRYDRHWNAAGAARTGQEIARVIRTAFPGIDLPPATFRAISAAGLKVNGGILGDYLNTCLGETPSTAAIKAAQQEDVPVQRLEAVDPGTLLDDPAYPVVLTGTSLSRLGGTSAVAIPLQQRLNTNVLDASVVAGGPFGSITAYLTSDAYRSTPPKVLVWESEANGAAPTDVTGFRQVIPSVYGRCTEGTQLGSGTLALAGPPGAQDLLRVPAGQVLGGHQVYLAFHSTDPGLVDFTVTFHFKGGALEAVPISRTTRIPNGGQFYLELPDRLNDGAVPGPLERVTLTPTLATAAGAHVDAALCRAPR